MSRERHRRFRQKTSRENEIETRKESNSPSVYSAVIRTTELTSDLRISIDEIKETKKELETNLTNSEMKIQELEKQLYEAKERAEQRKKKIEELGKTANPVYKKTIDFLKTKSSFLNARRETIEELKNCYNKWDKFGRRNTVVIESGSAISGVGDSITNIITFGISKAVGEAIKAGGNFSKIIMEEKGNKEFQISLSDEEELVKLNNSYDSLIDLIQENEEVNNILVLKTRRLRDGKAKLFEKKYEIFDILINDGVWEDRHLSLEKMEVAITSLNKNLKEEMESEWEEQFDKLKLKISRKYGKLILQEQNIQFKVQQLKNRLNELINSANDKLKSKRWSFEEKEKRNKEREMLLQKFLNNQESLTYSEKELLERKLTKESLDNLCRVQVELTKSKLELEELRNQQQEAQILSPTSPNFPSMPWNK